MLFDLLSRSCLSFNDAFAFFAAVLVSDALAQFVFISNINENIYRSVDFFWISEVC